MYCYSFFCFLFVIFPIMGILALLHLLVCKFFYLIFFAASYSEAFSEFFPYSYSWILAYYHYFLAGTIYFFCEVIPHLFVFILCQVFYGFITKKIQELKKLKVDLTIDKVCPKLDFYVERMKIMKQTLLRVFGFLVGLRFLTWVFFHNSFVMEIFAYGNVGVLMAFLLTERTRNENDSQNLTNRALLYNFVLIFFSSLIIDDTFKMITGYRFLFL